MIRLAQKENGTLSAAERGKEKTGRGDSPRGGRKVGAAIYRPSREKMCKSTGVYVQGTLGKKPGGNKLEEGKGGCNG